jgi:hypothetical protein
MYQAYTAGAVVLRAIYIESEHEVENIAGLATCSQVHPKI